MPVNKELLASLLAPIPGENPGGSDLRYDPKYDACKEARREDVLIPGADSSDRKVADWNRVVALASELLSGGSKDVQLAAWLTEALLRRGGVGGLLTGIELLRSLLEQFWDHLYPEIEDGDLELRAGPLEWIGGNPGFAVQNTAIASGGLTLLQLNEARSVPTEAEIEAASYEQAETLRARRAEAVRFGKTMPEAAVELIAATGKAFYKAILADIKATMDAIRALDAQAEARFGRDGPSFSKLSAALEELRLVASSTLAVKLESDPDPIEVVEEAEADAVVEGDGTLTAEPTSARDASQRIGVVAKWFRHQNASDPVPYAMLRAYRWGELRASSPDIDPRLLEAPLTAARARIKGLLLDGRWSEVLEHGEVLMSTTSGRGWLDLQRYTLTACGQLGASYDAVAAVVRSELRALLAAVPNLPRMTLMDDTPTANEETRDWLAQEKLTAPAPTPDADTESETTADAEPSDRAETLEMALAQDAMPATPGGAKSATRRVPAAVGRDPFDLARRELTQGRPNRAIELLTDQLAMEVSPRARFVRQTQLAWVMVEAGMFNVATPILSRLVTTIDERKLEEWESGPLVALPLALSIRVIDKTSGDATDRAGFYLRVCQLDPLQAIALGAS